MRLTYPQLLLRVWGAAPYARLHERHGIIHVAAACLSTILMAKWPYSGTQVQTYCPVMLLPYALCMGP